MLKRISVCFLVYFIARLLFILFNRNSFQAAGAGDFLSDFFFGLRFDAFSIVVSNSLFILLSIIPFIKFWKKGFQALLFWIFMICNAVFTAANFIDIGYFPFTRKRASADLFAQLGGQSDLGKLLPRFLSDFWPLLLLYIGTVALMAFLYKRVRFKYRAEPEKTTAGKTVLIVIVFILSVGFSVLAVRGGLQRVPIDIVNAGSVTSPEEVPIVLNTPFTLIKSHNQQVLEQYDFYTEDKADKLFSTQHHYKNAEFKKRNVVVLILESFSKEYTSLGRNKGITPFLDSLMRHSLLCDNAYSNGTKSIEGIPAILSSLPSLMENPFVNSLYANNYQTSFASLLNREGYQTAFFHGGINGTMNFDNWAALAGYQRYFGRNEYMNDDEFDGYWGIWDEPFLQYSIQKMNEFKEPFHSAIFTLSSHHPYFVPKQYKNKFPKGELENEQSIRYADFALRQFFATASKMPWYQNTLFVLTADHTGISGDPFYSNPVGNLSIPILFYQPDGGLKGRFGKVFSQSDILPSTLELLGYNKAFFAFGKSMAENHDHHCYYYANGTHFIYTDSLTYFFNGAKAIRAHHYKQDSLLQSDILGKNPGMDSIVTVRHKAFLQVYNRTLLRNEGRLENREPDNK